MQDFGQEARKVKWFDVSVIEAMTQGELDFLTNFKADFNIPQEENYKFMALSQKFAANSFKKIAEEFNPTSEIEKKADLNYEDQAETHWKGYLYFSSI